MALISIILGLFLDRTFRHLHNLRDMTWFEYYTRSIQRISGRQKAAIQFIIIIAPPVLLMLLIQLFLDDLLFDLPAFIFGVIVFIYCLGPACLSTDIETYIHARTSSDEDEALHYAGAITGASASTAPEQQTLEVTHAILHIANERLFSTIFWFIVLGPFGAIFYRLVSELSKQSEFKELAEFSDFIQAIMAWLPARMLAAGYALTGNFDGAYHGYRNRTHSDDILQSNSELLIATGLGAMHNLEMENELSGVHAAQALVIRTVIVWIGILAVMTLGGVFN